MKRLIFIMAVLLMPLCIQAQRSSLLGKKSVTTKVDNSAYEKEQIVETDGKVTFRTTLNAEGKTKAELYALVGRWAAFRYEPSTENGVWTDDDYFRNLEYACIKTADPNAGTIECLGDEEMVFSNKVLAKDYCRVNYTLNIHVADGTVSAELINIYYTYALGLDPERLTAEEWITDTAARNKKGKLMKANAKFRIKTIDLRDELFSEIEQAIKGNQ